MLIKLNSWHSKRERDRQTKMYKWINNAQSRLFTNDIETEDFLGTEHAFEVHPIASIYPVMNKSLERAKVVERFTTYDITLHGGPVMPNPSKLFIKYFNGHGFWTPSLACNYTFWLLFKRPKCFKWQLECCKSFGELKKLYNFVTNIFIRIKAIEGM